MQDGYRQELVDSPFNYSSGAHTFGRAYKDRSGAGAEKTKYTDGTTPQKRVDGAEATFKHGGSSWTEQFLVFDNSYFRTMKDESADPELLKLSTDKVLFKDPAFKPFAEKFAESQEEFFASYKTAHEKLSALGSKFDPEEGILL